MDVGAFWKHFGLGKIGLVKGIRLWDYKLQAKNSQLFYKKPAGWDKGFVPFLGGDNQKW